MSLHSGNRPELTCAEFEESFDAYVDDVLDPAVAAAARRHCSMCTPCNREVLRWQQTRILLSTAVADFATAVDVSSVRSDVFAALGLSDGDQAATERRGGMREAAYDRDASTRDARRAARSSRSDRAAGKRAGERRGSFGAAIRAASAAAVSAAVAAVAVISLTPPQQIAGPLVAKAPAVASVSSARPNTRSLYQPASFRLGSTEPTRPTYAPPPLARPETPRVDGLEAADGHMASTWVQPRTNARVIWVQNRGLGAPIRTAGLDR